MRKVKSLSDADIRRISPDKKYLFDGDGLMLEVMANGKKAWRFRYKSVSGKTRKMSFGCYPDVSLKDARRMRDDMRRKIASGVDPLDEKRDAQEAARIAAKAEMLAQANLFSVIAGDWFEIWSANKAPATVNGKRRFLGYLLNAFGNTPIQEITAQSVRDVALLFQSDGKGETAHRIIMTATQIFDHAIALNLVNTNPAARISRTLKPAETKHLPAIVDPCRFGQLLRDIDCYKGVPSVQYCLRILPYLPLRSTELREARWNELDFAAAEWTIPAFRGIRRQDGGGMKMRKEHIVPLSRQVISLFKALKIYTGNGELCFPGERQKDQCITGNALWLALKRMGYQHEACIHGFRTTFSTIANEKGMNADWIEAQLAHKEPNAIRDAYNRAEYMNDRRIMMQEWADYLDSLKTDATAK